METTSIQKRTEIIRLIRSAQHKVQIVVSWMTDELIINQLIETAKTKRVQVILSCDPLNIFRYEKIMQLKRSGGLVVKHGANFPGENGFMHAKFIMIDEALVYGGSFNFTNAANFNYENFDQYVPNVLSKYKTDFTNLWAKAKDYTIGFENQDEVMILIQEQFKKNEAMRDRLVQNMDNQFTNERETIIKRELELMKKRTQAIALQSANCAISPQGKVVEPSSGQTSKPHRFYGGTLLKTKFDGKKPVGCYHAAKTQMVELSRKFPFIKSRIEGDTLIANGHFSLENCPSYKMQIEYRLGMPPKVYILNQDITPAADIHIYKEGSLCLYYPGDLKWKQNTSIATYIIPWIFEWILFYEIHQLTGIWEAPAVAHGATAPLDLNI